jgi:CheY-like chemotaxis protein
MGQSEPIRPMTLVVEDDYAQREMISFLLEESDCTVLLCQSAEAAELVLKDVGTDLSLLLTDVSLAGPMSGVELAFMARQNLPHLDIIVTSARPLPGPLPDGARFWAKPWSAIDVLREAQRLMSLQSGSASEREFAGSSSTGDRIRC